MYTSLKWLLCWHCIQRQLLLTALRLLSAIATNWRVLQYPARGQALIPAYCFLAVLPRGQVACGTASCVHDSMEVASATACRLRVLYYPVSHDPDGRFYPCRLTVGLHSCFSKTSAGRTSLAYLFL